MVVTKLQSIAQYSGNHVAMIFCNHRSFYRLQGRKLCIPGYGVAHVLTQEKYGQAKTSTLFSTEWRIAYSFKTRHLCSRRSNEENAECQEPVRQSLRMDRQCPRAKILELATACLSSPKNNVARFSVTQNLRLNADIIDKRVEGATRYYHSRKFM